MKFDSNNIKTDEKLYKNILIYDCVYVTIKVSKYLKINSINPLQLIFTKVNGFFKEINKNKHLALVPNNESKELLDHCNFSQINVCRNYEKYKNALK